MTHGSLTALSHHRLCTLACSLLLVTLSGVTLPAPAGDFASHARALRQELRDKVLPYWFDTAQDTNQGGYLLADDGKSRGGAKEKQLVSQTRMIWGFSHAHRNGFSSGRRNYLTAAEQGYRFLVKHFRDAQFGGYFWKTDLAGKIITDRKLLYGEAFVIYALVEYHRASGDVTALALATELYQALQRHAHDAQHGGWQEHFARDWTPLNEPYPGNEVEVPGYRSANAHLHWMEALAELYEATRDEAVKKSLQEALEINRKHFYPKAAGKSCFHRKPDWQPVTDPKSAGLSYGHNVEFAWLMIRAEQVLGRKPSWSHFDAHLKHALKYGYDHERGGVYNLGEDDRPATKLDKVWWVQSEMLAALTDGLVHRRNRDYERALEKLLHFVWQYQVDPVDGIWFDTVTADGQPKSRAKAPSWKANYHDVRGMMKFITAFER